MILISLSVFLIAVVIHEYAHGWVACKLGDNTAKYSGRLTLNPIVHIDPIGTLLLPLMLVMMKSPVVFGWAKPVPINPSLLRNPKRDMLWVSIAGITANILMAAAFAILLHIGIFPVNTYGGLFLSYAVIINLILAVFNAVPIPPLDGSKVLMSILPARYSHSFMQLERYGFLILIGLLWLGLVDYIILPIVIFMAKILGVAGYF